MSTTETPPVSQFDLETTPGQGGIGEAAGAYWDRIKGGDLGALPAIFGVVVLVIVFGVMEPDTFLTEQNFANLINQGAAIMVLAMGLVFVLLLGEIDLSAGFTAGTGAAILGVTLTEHGWAWPLSVLAALATGVAIGFTIALLVARLGIPSFVVSLAYFLGPAGRDAADHRRGRDDPDPQRRDPDDHEQEHAGRARLAARVGDHRRVRGGRRSGRSRAGARPGCRRPRCRCGRSRWSASRSSCSCSSTCSIRSASVRTRRSRSRACRGWCRWWWCSWSGCRSC